MQDALIPTAHAVLNACGENCGTLTPAIKAGIRDLQSGQILEVIADEPSAPEGVAAWSRLTGNKLLAMTTGSDDTTHFYIQKK